MSKKTEAKGSGTPAEAASHDLVDDQRGVYGWFRRHQKKLLYSVGLFVLITFSVSGPMMATIGEWFGVTQLDKMPTIKVGAERVKMMPEDYDWGQRLAQSSGIMSLVLPRTGTSDGGTNELSGNLAILRRAAITLGIDVSLEEVRRAIQTQLDQSNIETVAQLARQWSFGSEAALRQMLAEGMRIGTLLRLETLALDNSERGILERLILDKEKVTFRVATFDEKGLEESLKGEGELSDEDLEAWLEAKEKGEQRRLQVFGPNQSKVVIGALLFDEFDATEWSEILSDYQIGEEQLEKLWNTRREDYKNEDDTYKPVADPEVTAELTVLLQTEHVMQTLLRQSHEKNGEFCKDVNEEQQRLTDQFFLTKQTVSDLEQKLQDQPEGPEREATKAELETARKLLAEHDELRQAATEKATARYAEFDFKAAFTELTVGKKGIVVREITELRDPDGYKDLESDGLGLGEWAEHYNARGNGRKGQFCMAPQRTDKAAMIYQVTEAVLEPRKPWEELKPRLEDAYYTEKASEQAEAAKAALETALLRLAKAKVPAEVVKIEEQRQSRIDAKVAEWEEQTNGEIAAAEKLLAGEMGRRARKAQEGHLLRLQGVLGSKAAQVARFEKETDVAIEKEIGDLAMEHHHEVLDQAAEEAGFTVQDVGPLSREAMNKPRFAKRFDKTTVFLFQQHSDLEENESTGVVQDRLERRWHAAFCKGVTDLEYTDIERREFEQWRTGGGGNWSYATRVQYEAFSQAFTRKALEARYDVVDPVGEQSVEEPVEPDTGETTEPK